MSKIAVIGLVGNSAFLSVDEFHKGGETLIAKDIYFEPGGKGFNQAVAAARFGSEVSFLSAVGYDYYETAENFLKKEKIKSFLQKKDAPSAYASIITDKHGNTRVTVFQGAKLNINDVLCFEKEIKEADVLLINNEVDDEVNEKAIQIAKSHETKIILNPAPKRKICKYILENTDYFTPNEFEAENLKGVKNLIITQGAKGCFVAELNKTFHSINVTAVDTTGAGDTFNGVFASAINDYNLENAIKYAIVASGLSVAKKHVLPSIPKKDEIFSFLKNQSE